MANTKMVVKIMVILVMMIQSSIAVTSGSVPLLSSASLFVPNLQVKLDIIEAAANLETPQIDYSIDLDVTELFKVSGSSITFDLFKQTTIVKSDGSFLKSNGMLMSTALGIAGGLVFSESPILSFVTFSTLSMFALSNAANPALQLTLRVPPNYQFGSLIIDAPYATITSTSTLYVDSLIMKLCAGTSTSNTISLTGIYVYTKLEACAIGNVNLQKIRTSSNKVDISVSSSSGSVTTSFLSGYFGKFEANSKNNKVQIQGDCSSDGQKGSCGKHSNTIAKFNAENEIQVNFGTGCEADWLGDPDAIDQTSTNENPLSYVPSYVVNVSDGDPSIWSYYMPSGQQNSYSLAGTGADAGATVVYQESWANKFPHIWYTISKRVLPKLYKGFSYKIEFDFRQHEDNVNVAINPNGAFNFSQFSIVIFENHESVWHAAESAWFYWVAANASYDPKYSLGYCNLSNTDVLATSTYTRLSCTVSPSRNSTNAVVAFRAVNKNTNEQNFYYYFKDVHVITPDTPVYTPPLLTRDSELITLRKPSPKLESNPRSKSDCPHKMANLRFFHDPSIWPGSRMPSSDGTITLPANTNVLVSSCSVSDKTIYNKIVIPATSALIFDDAPIDFHVHDILVQGKFLIGSQKCRIFSNITITFHGANTTLDSISGGMGSKGMGVQSGGVVEIHGKQFHNSWSRIAASAAGGDDRVYLQDDVNWEVGQQIVVTATILNDLKYNQNEVVTIVAKTGRTVVFTPPLRYLHYGGQEYQAEVGVLDRRITIQGNFADSEADNSSFGGHIQIMGQGRFSGVRFYRMGQLNRLARYPVHYHMIGHGGNGSFVQDCSFYKCFYRCVSIHGTYDTELLRNVAFDIKGHCYYLEDGTEENNTISFNLASYIKPIGRPAEGFAQAGETLEQTPELTNPADSAAAGFYITNAYNRIVGNAASGGWAGFSFPNMYSPIHLNAYRAPFDPSGRPTLEFDSNTARGSGNIFGNSGCIYVGGLLTHQKDDNNTGTTPLSYINGRTERTTRIQQIPEPYGSPKANFTMTNIKTSLCSMGVAHWSDCDLFNYESHDNFRAAMMFGKSWMGNALVVGRTANPLSGTPPLGLHQGFEFYDTYTHTILTNVIFRNFHLIPNLASSDPHNDNKVFVSMTHSDVFKPEAMSVARNITFQDVEPNAVLGVNEQNTGSSRMFNLYDTDGTIAKQMGIDSKGKPVIIGSYISWWNFHSGCKFHQPWNSWVCPRQQDEQEIIYIGLYVPKFIDYGVTQQSYDHVGKISLFGNGIPINDIRSLPITRNSGITGISHLGWLFELDNGSPAYIEINTIQIPRDSYFILSVPYPSGTTFKIETMQWNNVWLPFYYTFVQVNTFEELRNGNATQYYFDGSHLFVKVKDFAIDNIEDFYRDNAVVHTYNNGFLYYIRAICPSTTKIGEVDYCNNTPTNRPSYNW